MFNLHFFKLTVKWVGNKGAGTSKYDSYARDHLIHVENKPALLGSSDPVFKGDGSKYNPEDLFIASMLWYLYLCADAVVVC
jgi:organic hydroperoxide reductase OsmC/OhrA